MRILLLLAACSSTSGPLPDVVAPFNGEVHRYAVDSITLPMSRLTLADDLDGDGRVDNQLGNIINALAANADAPLDTSDLIASGALAPVFELTSADLRNDDRAGARFAEGGDGELVGGRLQGGVFVSNRTRDTQHPASMVLRLPVFVDADPLQVTLVGVEIDFATDPSGLTGTVRGGILHDDVVRLMAAGTQEMLANNDRDHIFLMGLLDMDPQDWKLDSDEIANNALYKNVALADADFYDQMGQWHPGAGGRDVVSVAFGFHAVPCDSGRCSTAVPRDYCRDRVTDDDESDHDCGGSTCSLRCAAGKHCNSGDDCQSGTCNSGVCGAPSCSDGRRNQFEGDADCGGPCPVLCAAGKSCLRATDCDSGKCDYIDPTDPPKGKLCSS